MWCPKSWCFGSNLRAHCLTIGYLHMIVSFVDIVCHVVIVLIATNGFQCDTKKDNLHAMMPIWDWLHPLLLIINIGTHGFYPYPIILSYYNRIDFDIPMSHEPRCYPGMMHLHVEDILYFLVNIIWLNFVVSFVGAVHKKDPKPISSFFTISVVKLGLQILYSYQSDSIDVISVSVFKLVDVGISAIFLLIIYTYSKKLRHELARKNGDRPPAYIECLIKDPTTLVDEKKDAVLTIEEKTKTPEEIKEKC